MLPLRPDHEGGKQTALQAELYVQIQPALPRSFTAVCEQETLVLGVRENIKVRFVGLDEREVKLSKEVSKRWVHH